MSEEHTLAVVPRLAPFLPINKTETERIIIPTINLRDLYSTLYTTDEFIDISDEIAELFLADKRWEAAHVRRMYRHKAQYSLDCNDGIENAIITFPETLDEAYEQKDLRETIYAAIDKLPEKQRRRVIGFYFKGLKKIDMANLEGIAASCVCGTVQKGLVNLKKLLDGKL